MVNSVKRFIGVRSSDYQLRYVILRESEVHPGHYIYCCGHKSLSYCKTKCNYLGIDFECIGKIEESEYGFKKVNKYSLEV